MDKKRHTILIVGFIGLLVVLLIVSSIFTFMIPKDLEKSSGYGNIAIIPVKGIILSESQSGFFSSNVASSTNIVNMIEKADSNPSVKAIILEINSPGGSPVASEEITNALKKSDKLKVAWIREVGASGAYWIASGCDKIVASRMSITGSIGVIASYLEFSGLMKEYNVTYQRMTSGKYKDIGSPYRKLTQEEESILQGQLDKIHEFFIEEVATNRGMSIEKTKEAANGLFYIGSDAKDLGLVDILGGKEEALIYIEHELNIKARLIEYNYQPTFIELLAGVIKENSFYLGFGIGSGMITEDNSLIKI